MAIPQIAPEGSPEEETAESPEMEQKEGKFEIKCAAKDCVHNGDGYCKTDISVSGGPAPKCETYSPKGSPSMGGMKPPAPPVPMMKMGM